MSDSSDSDEKGSSIFDDGSDTDSESDNDIELEKVCYRALLRLHRV